MSKGKLQRLRRFTLLSTIDGLVHTAPSSSSANSGEIHVAVIGEDLWALLGRDGQVLASVAAAVSAFIKGGGLKRLLEAVRWPRREGDSQGRRQTDRQTDTGRQAERGTDRLTDSKTGGLSGRQPDRPAQAESWPRREGGKKGPHKPCVRIFKPVFPYIVQNLRGCGVTAAPRADVRLPRCERRRPHVPARAHPLP